ncbi:MAG: DUF1499 domain-containing protein [Gammaproteobacteria bacterium]|nr:DUF1499 domain-containing protein [Gammaproteobacteria bacterium]
MKIFQWLVVSLSMVGVLLVVVAGPATRADVWSLATAFQLLRWGAWLGAAGAAGCLLALVVSPKQRRATALLVPAFLAGLLAFAVPAAWRAEARRVPPIHDISTDTANPPGFRAILPLRAGAPNPAEYGGEKIAAQQRTAYPQIQPLVLTMERAACYSRALSAARAMGWELVAEEPDSGRIEATATTLWFGFKDDVVIRLAQSDQSCRVDVRSVSRVGRSDVGANARRIRAYLERLAD